jgi:hypothetical protein
MGEVYSAKVKKRTTILIISTLYQISLSLVPKVIIIHSNKAKDKIDITLQMGIKTTASCIILLRKK